MTLVVVFFLGFALGYLVHGILVVVGEILDEDRIRKSKRN